MSQIITLCFFVLWGALMSFACHVFTSAKRGIGIPELLEGFLLVTGAAAALFLSVLFLLTVNNGILGLYGIPCLILGFYMYRKILYRPLDYPLLCLWRAGHRLKLFFKRCILGVAEIIAKPMGLIVHLAEHIIGSCLDKRYHKWEHKQHMKALANDEANLLEYNSETDEENTKENYFDNI